MNVIFAGTPEFAARSLQALLSSDHRIIAVLTQPDRPSGRGRQLTASPVKQLAQTHNIEVFQPTSLKDETAHALINSLNADVMVVVAYGLLLPENILQLPRLGCLNIHASLLPRWRGAAPIQRAIEAGDTKTGVCIMQMDAGLDTGDVLKIGEIEIDQQDTAASLHDKLAQLGAGLIVSTLDQLQCGEINPQPQDEQGANYANKLHKDESWIDWQQSAQQIVNKIHGFNPWPGAKTHYQEQELKLLRAQVVQVNSEFLPGTIIQADKAIIVQTGDQGVEILQLQKSGARPMHSKEFLNGFELKTQVQLS